MVARVLEKAHKSKIISHPITARLIWKAFDHADMTMLFGVLLIV